MYFEVSYTFNDLAQVETLKYPDGNLVVKKLYDELNRVTKIQKKYGAGSYTDIATWVHQGPQKMKTLEMGNARRKR